MKWILLVEDDLSLINGLSFAVKKQGYMLDVAHTKDEADRLWENGAYDLVILDVSLPDGSGFDICKRIRQASKVPIMFLTAMDEETDIIMGLDIGGDDYITKPFSPKILLAKINALLRRAASANPQDMITAGEIVLQLSSRTVTVCGMDLSLTHKEFELLRLFMLNKNQVFSRDQLLNRIWGYDFEGNTRTVDTHIKTLRQKLGSEGQHIVTLIRSGYKFEV